MVIRANMNMEMDSMNSQNMNMDSMKSINMNCVCPNPLLAIDTVTKKICCGHCCRYIDKGFSYLHFALYNALQSTKTQLKQTSDNLSQYCRYMGLVECEQKATRHRIKCVQRRCDLYFIKNVFFAWKEETRHRILLAQIHKQYGFVAVREKKVYVAEQTLLREELANELANDHQTSLEKLQSEHVAETRKIQAEHNHNIQQKLKAKNDKIWALTKTLDTCRKKIKKSDKTINRFLKLATATKQLQEQHAADKAKWKKLERDKNINIAQLCLDLSRLMQTQTCQQEADTDVCEVSQLKQKISDDDTLGTQLKDCKRKLNKSVAKIAHVRDEILSFKKQLVDEKETYAKHGNIYKNLIQTLQLKLEVTQQQMAPWPPSLEDLFTNKKNKTNLNKKELLQRYEELCKSDHSVRKLDQELTYFYGTFVELVHTIVHNGFLQMRIQLKISKHWIHRVEAMHEIITARHYRPINRLAFVVQCVVCMITRMNDTSSAFTLWKNHCCTGRCEGMLRIEAYKTIGTNKKWGKFKTEWCTYGFLPGRDIHRQVTRSMLTSFPRGDWTPSLFLQAKRTPAYFGSMQYIADIILLAREFDRKFNALRILQRACKRYIQTKQKKGPSTPNEKHD